MESQEQSTTSKDLEKDVTLNSEPAQEQNTGSVNNQPEASSAAAEQAQEVVNPGASQAAAASTPAEETVQAEPQEKQPASVETEAQPQHKYAAMSKTELIAALELLKEQPIDSVKDDVAQIKSAFFAIRKEEIAKEKEAFLAQGNEEAAFVAIDDADEVKIKELLNELKEKKAQFNAEQDALRAENLEKKRKIIDEINAIVADPDNVNRQYNHIQQLQQEFKAIGEVPATNVTELWKSYQLAVEKFYDLLKMNKELRDYDFKKNLEIKQQLCSEAEALDDQNDVVAAFKKLQELHDTWRETGPVAKEIREELWQRFKNASSVINKKYQGFFEERKAKEKENAEAKTALCEKIEAISTDGLKTYAAWDEATKGILALQEQWKKLGFASRKQNAELFARFRKSCDDFFGKKAEFFKQMKEQFAANLAKKTELCERAEAMKDSTDWKKTTDAFVALQKEWKTVGPVVKKHSDAIWKRFITACDAFFDNKKKQNTNIHTIEHDNLKTKKGIIAQVNAVLEADNKEDGPTQVRELMKQWQEVGHVPYKEKDKIYAEYKAAIDKAFEQFDMKGMNARIANFENSLNKMGGDDKVYHERERLVRDYERKCQEMKTYENNMGFFNASSKNGSTIVKQMEKKIANLKDEIAILEKKIKMIDDKV